MVKIPYYLDKRKDSRIGYPVQDKPTLVWQVLTFFTKNAIQSQLIRQFINFSIITAQAVIIFTCDWNSAFIMFYLITSSFQNKFQGWLNRHVWETDLWVTKNR